MGAFVCFFLFCFVLEALGETDKFPGDDTSEFFENVVFFSWSLCLAFFYSRFESENQS